MSKVKLKTILNIPIIPTSVNFSVMNSAYGFNEDGEREEFDAGDDGRAENKIFSDIQAGNLLLDILFKMNDRQKIIFMYQLLREAGYGITHQDCAKTLSLTREHYIFLVGGVKKKAQKILQANEK